MILYEKGQLGAHNPNALLNTVWWNNCRHFGMRGGREHHDLRWGDVKLMTNSGGKEYLEYSERQTKTRQGDNPRNIRSVKPTMWSTSSDINDNRNPVSVYKQYRDRRPKDMFGSDSPFYLGINHVRQCPAAAEVFVSSKPWYQ